MGNFLKKLLQEIYLLSILILFNSCLEPIEFKTPKQLNLLVVDGKITNSLTGNIIKLSRTSETDRILEPVFGATVKIYDNTGREENYYSRHDLGGGTYFHKGDIVKGESGLTYFIEITLIEDGSVYRSIPETMPYLTATDSAYIDFKTIKEQNNIGEFVDRKVVEIFTNTKIEQQNSSVFLKWNIEEAYKLSPTDFPDPFGNVPEPCYITAITNPQDVILFNGDLVKSDRITNKLISTRGLDYAFLDRFFFNINLSSLTREAYTYWNAVNQIVNNVGSIFDSPPAPIKGNIYNINNQDEQVLGYFQASSIKTSRIMLLRADIPFFIPPYCEYIPGKDDYPDLCLNCLSIPTSTLERPDYFD
ncbi:hypothetical protein BH23BAC1_BH23BAC1_49420 [soil metagenome]